MPGAAEMAGHADSWAHQEITDCLLRYCWGIDRGELALVLSAFHPNARDNHSGVEEDAMERFTRTVVEGGPMKTSHNLSNILIQFDGEQATSQSYFTARHQFDHDGATWDWIISGRYLDRHEYREGRWGIVHHTVGLENGRGDFSYRVLDRQSQNKRAAGFTP